MHDLVIEGATVVDGTGAPARAADVAVRDGLIVEVGRITSAARERISAPGAWLTPGFIDLHTPMLGADGLARPELFRADRLHLNERGYALWHELIAAHFTL